jgi:hypothetical protein
MYTDRLIDITGDTLTLKKYYFPFGFPKHIALSDIARVRVEDPILLNGKFRVWGSSSLRTWFGLDPKRPFRDVIFIVELKDSWFRSGFTCEASADVVQELIQKGVPVERN